MADFLYSQSVHISRIIAINVPLTPPSTPTHILKGILTTCITPMTPKHQSSNQISMTKSGPMAFSVMEIWNEKTKSQVYSQDDEHLT